VFAEPRGRGARGALELVRVRREVTAGVQHETLGLASTVEGSEAGYAYDGGGNITSDRR
jgi:hypothetical protein